MDLKAICYLKGIFTIGTNGDLLIFVKLVFTGRYDKAPADFLKLTPEGQEFYEKLLINWKICKINNFFFGF